MATVSSYLIRSLIPGKYLPADAPINKKTINAALSAYAADAPENYAKNVPAIKRLGDDASLYEGISSGLDDIAPEYSKRDKIFSPAFNKIKRMTDLKAKADALVKLQTKMMVVAGEHKGDMGLMVRSGGRGNAAQLMKTVVSPVVVSDLNNEVIPWGINRSFSQGLTTDEYWATASEARKLAVMSNNSVTIPGEMGKMLVHTMGDQVITVPDCGTHNGMLFPTTDSSLAGRYLAKPVAGLGHNTALTTAVLAALRKGKVKEITARSILTCEAKEGVCQYCYGQDVYGKLPSLGTNVGMRGAHALSEPLTQTMLSSKHGMRVEDSSELGGLAGLKLLVNVPKVFAGAATLASRRGVVDSIREAPQGGSYITVDGGKHYVNPSLKLAVREGDSVEAGDALSSGVPKPDEIVRYKGIGPGRAYYAKRVYNTFNSTITSVDPRHVDLLARAHIRYGKVTDDPTSKLLRGDVVPYSALRDVYREGSKDTPIADIRNGSLLAGNYNEYVSGTVVTPSVKKELIRRGHKILSVAGKEAPRVEYIMRPLTHAPLLDSDWVARLGHRNLKTSILTGAARGDESPIHSYNPVAPYVLGTEFGLGTAGKY